MSVEPNARRVYRCLDVAARISKDEVDDGLLDAELVVVFHLVDETADEVRLAVTQSRREQRQDAIDPRPIERRDVLRVDAVRNVVVVPARRDATESRTHYITLAS